MMHALGPVFAHYGGIDEIGIFVVPAVAVILILRWAERRAREKMEGEEEEPEAEGGVVDQMDSPRDDG